MYMIEALSDRGLKRWRNEDAADARELPDGAQLLVVADGMGGHADGNVASRTALEAVIEHCETESGTERASETSRRFPSRKREGTESWRERARCRRGNDARSCNRGRISRLGCERRR